jgi:MFS superfamily sulfate permease-like transporter
MKFSGQDLRASLVVFLVALPLCLGIALASGAPLSAGIISGIIGGVVIGLFGGSEISVSGPAAGLTVIVASAIIDLGNYSSFSTAIAIAGVLQLAMGFLKAGELGNFFPASVIKGMLASIGIILILKQIPHAVGWDADYMGDESFGAYSGNNTMTYIMQSWERLHIGSTIIALISLATILVWDKFLSKKIQALALIPSALIAVTISVLINEYLFVNNSDLLIESTHLVQLPFSGGFNSFIKELSYPTVSALLNPLVWKVALTIAIVASLETLLSLDAADKIDPLKRLSLKNKELRAQGLGNFISGLLGGLPMTAVIVRTSANVNSQQSFMASGFWPR